MTRAPLTTAEDRRDFVTAGRAVFTAESRVTGSRFTFRVRRPDPEKVTGDLLFVDVLAGPDNADDYMFLGTIFDGRDYRPSKKSRAGESAPSQQAFAWLWRRIVAGREIPECDLYHEGRCGRCGRRLTVPESIRSGLGPVCAEQMESVAA